MSICHCKKVANFVTVQQESIVISSVGHWKKLQNSSIIRRKISQICQWVIYKNREFQNGNFLKFWNFRFLNLANRSHGKKMRIFSIRCVKKSQIPSIFNSKKYWIEVICRRKINRKFHQMAVEKTTNFVTGKKFRAVRH